MAKVAYATQVNGETWPKL